MPAGISSSISGKNSYKTHKGDISMSENRIFVPGNEQTKAIYEAYIKVANEIALRHRLEQGSNSD